MGVGSKRRRRKKRWGRKVSDGNATAIPATHQFFDAEPGVLEQDRGADVVRQRVAVERRDVLRDTRRVELVSEVLLETRLACAEWGDEICSTVSKRE